jgi:hypothetical protein
MVEITWDDSPDTHGTPLTSYTIYLGQADGTYTESNECDGATPDVFNNRLCYVQMSTIREAPYSLALGELIQVKITATNLKGISDES